MEQMTFWKNTESVSKEIMELLKTIRGDITKITDVQAIVNAASEESITFNSSRSHWIAAPATKIDPSSA